MAPSTTGPAPAYAPRAEEGDTPASRFDDHLAAQFLAQRIVFLGTQVDEVSANRVCAQLLPHINAEGADRTEVGIAVQLIERCRSAQDFFHHTVMRVAELKKAPLRPHMFNVPSTIRLALEIAAQEEHERRALEGELAELESLWRRRRCCHA